MVAVRFDPPDERWVVRRPKPSGLPRPTRTTGRPLCTARRINGWRALETVLPHGVKPSTTKPARGAVLSKCEIKRFVRALLEVTNGGVFCIVAFGLPPNERSEPFGHYVQLLNLTGIRQLPAILASYLSLAATRVHPGAAGGL